MAQVRGTLDAGVRACVRTSERQRSLQAPTRSAAMIILPRTCLDPASIPILGCAQARDATMLTSRVPCACPDERFPVGDAAAVQDQWRKRTTSVPNSHPPRTHSQDTNTTTEPKPKSSFLPPAINVVRSMVHPLQRSALGMRLIIMAQCDSLPAGIQKRRCSFPSLADLNCATRPALSSITYLSTYPTLPYPTLPA
jgi:hypothetical protein